MSTLRSKGPHTNGPNSNGRARVLVLCGAALACVAVLLALRSLSVRPPRASAPRAERSAPSEPEPAQAARGSEPAGERQRAPAAEAGVESALAARVLDATEQLAQALLDPEYEHERWRAEVRARASTLGRGAIPALRGVLADGSRSVEEQVAANELLATLDAP